MEIAIIGPGAIGGFVAAQAAAAGHQVMVCARTAFDRLRVEADGRTTEYPVEIVTEERQGRPCEFVFLCTKAGQTQAAAGWLAATIGPRTRALVVLQNGVEQVERATPFAQGVPVLPCAIYIGSELIAPGHVRYFNLGATLELPAGPLCEELAAVFAGTPLRISPQQDMRTALWRKLLANAAANPITALTGQRAHVLARPELQDLIAALLDEVVAVARAQGAALGPADAAATLARFAQLKPASGVGSSMLYDRLAGRQMEFDALNGAVVRIGARHGISTPMNAAIVALLSVL
ncbi:MAG: 2-dehydropantoate 2-reductase [Gammaproteobacteria bacterium]